MSVLSGRHLPTSRKFRGLANFVIHDFSTSKRRQFPIDGISCPAMFCTSPHFRQTLSQRGLNEQMNDKTLASVSSTATDIKVVLPSQICPDPPSLKPWPRAKGSWS